MSERAINTACVFFAVAIGLAASSGYPAGLAAASAMPVACLLSRSRTWAMASAVGYYAASTWPMMPGLHRYLGHSAFALSPALIWAFSSLLLSAPWAIAWTCKSRIHFVWRVPLAQIVISLPPLGLVGFASPLLGAGFLFPASAWLGLVITAMLPALCLALIDSSFLRPALGAVFGLSVAFHAFGPSSSQSPERWESVDTKFGDISRPLQDYIAAKWIQQEAAASSARVLIFPESVVPRWSEATEVFWGETLDRCKMRGQILAIGAGAPRRSSNRVLRDEPVDMTAAINMLRSASLGPTENPLSQPDEEMDNILMLLGADSGKIFQRVPVPIGMWRPFRKGGVPLHLEGPGVIAIDGQRAAVLICYEQILAYPMLTSMMQKPTVLVGISNMYWFSDTTLPRYQSSVVRAWARLFHLPCLLAVNS